jgi:hypothetical protein
MKKRTGSPPAVTGQASLDFMVGHIIEVVQATLRIPAHRGQSFRFIVGTDSGTIVGSDSGPSWAPIPVHRGHPFRCSVST